MADKETGFFRGEGGVVFEMDLPLSEVMADKVTRGTLRRVNEDGTPWRDESEQDVASEGSDLTNGVTPRPAVNASKAEWVGYAVTALGMNADDAEAATKQDLIDLAK
ncbi:hypothetical protein DMH01_03330 [Amycolatopsis sp. WAC 04182]|uniref:hypothetical protein n=1 Tax=Amycolatopsis sp. WAC 04182 TaxID=2203198 RepID=UPI000F771CDA|nr:hypothetical protein [Amycolatopsis sp. WAC 04182]RSN65423.1 hypothetical protein DMH01_03330 [Amycolatopsis sp. WAC 04182]